MPTEWYNEYDHIGYNVDGASIDTLTEIASFSTLTMALAGEKIARRTKKGDRLDAFLDAHDKTKRWTLYDPVEDKGAFHRHQTLTPSRLVSVALSARYLRLIVQHHSHAGRDTDILQNLHDLHISDPITNHAHAPTHIQHRPTYIPRHSPRPLHRFFSSAQLTRAHLRDHARQA